MVAGLKSHSPVGDLTFRYQLDSDACGPETILAEPFFFFFLKVLFESADGSCPSSVALSAALH